MSLWLQYLALLRHTHFRHHFGPRTSSIILLQSPSINKYSKYFQPNATEPVNISAPINMEIHRDDQPHSSEFDLFVRSRIRRLDTLREHMGHANFVAMDTEHGVGVSSIGLAFASNLEPVRYLTHPGVLTGYIQGGPWPIPVARSICFNIRGYERSQPTQEQVWSQPDEDINIQDVASKVTDAVRNFKETQPGKPLILVTYSASAELSAISTLMPQLHHLFSNWVDIQPLVMEAYHLHTYYTRLDGLLVSLRCAMRALCFHGGYQPTRLHHAGNDALRTLAIMVCLPHENVKFARIRKLEYVLILNKIRNEQRFLERVVRSRVLLSNRSLAGPPSQYPHVAKVTVAPAPNTRPEVWAGYLPAGPVVHQEYGGPVYEPSLIDRVCRGYCYYGGLPSSEILQHLIEDLVKRRVGYSQF